MKSGVFIGVTTWDIVYYQDALPGENHKSKTEEYRTWIGGTAGNAAITYSILGGKAMLVTAIGDSEIGKNIKSELMNDYNIEVFDLLCGEKVLPFISSISVNTITADRTIWSGQQLDIKNKHFDGNEIINNADFCFADCQLPDAAIPILELAHRKNMPVVLDAGSWKPKMETFLTLATDVIASADFESPEHINTFNIFRKYNVINMAVSHGEKPLCWETAKENGEIPSVPVDAKDTLGAGDVLHGAYCFFKYARQLSFEESLQKASEVASLSVKYDGARQGVEEYCAQNPG